MIDIELRYSINPRLIIDLLKYQVDPIRLKQMNSILQDYFSKDAIPLIGLSNWVNSRPNKL